MERTDVKNNHTEEYSTGQIRCIEKSDPEYPQIMKQYSSMPAKLYVKGRLPDPKKNGGSDRCQNVQSLWKDAGIPVCESVKCSWVQIISGMALGIDSEGHKGALEGKMPTLRCLEVVLMYAIRNLTENSMRRILWENGGIISECPLGSGPVSWHFPARNRIISALSDAVLVVEAKKTAVR